MKIQNKNTKTKQKVIIMIINNAIPVFINHFNKVGLNPSRGSIGLNVETVV